MASGTGRTRRWLLSRGAAVAVTAAAATTLSAGEASALPAVDMELVLLAAQVDPPKAGTGLTPGASAHVLEVERALNAKGLLSSGAIDGHFGTSAIAAYAAWQRSLGYSGLDASGIPGTSSLTALGSGRFTVTRTVSAGPRTATYGGKKVNTRTRDMLAAADATLSWSLALDQGSYSTADPISAGTHDGGGAVGITATDLTTTQRWETVRALRTVGFAAWLRTPAQGSLPYHVHAADDTPAAYRAAFTWWEKHNRS